MDKNNEMKGGFIPETAEKPDKTEKQVKKAKKKSGKPGFFKRLGLKIKDVFSELKKVSWPSFSKVVKKTGVVIVVVLAFLVVITAFDSGLMELLKLIAPRA
ncbi:MAG: preprotein translocase subunit SecE [Candidatus Borkfalkiaceae bacterium]|nr:preprotein translocase subunit SecE [Christensenellaceae bacterium]